MPGTPFARGAGLRQGGWYPDCALRSVAHQGNASTMLDGRWRAKAEQGLEPIGRGLHAIGVSADALTVFGLVAAVGTALLIANGNLVLAVFGLILSGLPDILDGSVARHSGTAGTRGAFFDSVCDRVADAVILGGVAWHVADEDPRLSILAFAVLALTMLVSYERAKAESLGLERARRADGAPRAHGAARHRARVRRPRARPLDHARAHRDHRRPPLRDGVASGHACPGRSSAAAPAVHADPSCPAPAPPISRTGPALRRRGVSRRRSVGRSPRSRHAAWSLAWAAKRAQVRRHLVRASHGALHGEALDQATRQQFANYAALLVRDVPPAADATASRSRRRSSPRAASTSTLRSRRGRASSWRSRTSATGTWPARGSAARSRT